MAGGGNQRLKELRYNVMLALYLPILLYSFSTFDLDEETVPVSDAKPTLIPNTPKTVVLGQEFRANAFLTAQELASGGTIELSTDDEKVQVEGNESLRIATQKLLEEGENEKTVQYEVEMAYSGVGDTTLTETLRDSFTVRRPELVARSTATSSLYRQTLNELRIEVPGLENRTIQLRYGGQTTTGNQIQLTPSGDEVTVEALLPSEDGEPTPLGTKTFAVTDPPQPQVNVLGPQGQQLTTGDNLSLRQPNLRFEIKPDPEFARSYSQDANYNVGQVKVSVRRGLQPSEELGTFSVGNNGSLNLLEALRGVDVRAKDKVIIQVQEVVRRNHLGQTIPQDLNQSSLTYSFTFSS